MDSSGTKWDFLGQDWRIGFFRENIYHFAVVDTRRKLVYDPAERFTLKIGSGTLRACVGDEVDPSVFPSFVALLSNLKARKSVMGVRGWQL